MELLFQALLVLIIWGQITHIKYLMSQIIYDLNREMNEVRMKIQVSGVHHQMTEITNNEIKKIFWTNSIYMRGFRERICNTGGGSARAFKSFTRSST